jgi:hypothetical protein
MDVLQWARTNGCSWGAGAALANVAMRGDLAMFQWALANGCPWHKDTLSELLYGGSVEMLEWAIANGFLSRSDLSCSTVASTVRLDILRWMRANGWSWDVSTCSRAAIAGRLEVLQWAHENGCPWDEKTCEMAAHWGYLEVLQWARAGCPWNRQLCADLAEIAKHTVKQWMETLDYADSTMGHLISSIRAWLVMPSPRRLFFNKNRK